MPQHAPRRQIYSGKRFFAMPARTSQGIYPGRFRSGNTASPDRARHRQAAHRKRVREICGSSVYKIPIAGFEDNALASGVFQRINVAAGFELERMLKGEVIVGDYQIAP